METFNSEQLGRKVTVPANETDAENAFLEKMWAIEHQIIELQQELKASEEKFDGTNWGAVGDLGRISECLKMALGKE